MKLTPRSQGKKFRRPNWPEGEFWEIRKVGKGKVKKCEGINERGVRVFFVTFENETDWVEVKS